MPQDQSQDRPAPAPVPQHCPSARELDDLELLLGGALTPRTGYDTAGPVRLALPDELAGATVELVDPEGMPLARVAPDGTVSGLAARVTGAFRRLHLSPAATRERYAGALPVVVVGPPSLDDLALVEERRQGRPVLLLALSGAGTPAGLTPVGLLRAALVAARLLGDAEVVAVPFAAHGTGPGEVRADHDLAREVLATYTGEDVVELPGTGDLPDEVAAVVDSDQPPPGERGLVVFFTGLSGSGKSTLAQALHDLLLEDGARTVTSLDGDVVRRNLSAGLGFSRADRETNIRRIGWVAAEIARHRGIALCSPIAPYDETRQQVRDYVDDAGGVFFLVHVATPLAECERRDKKGLYAKARRGEVPEFTGISAPYEEPVDADVRVDTTGRSIAAALDDVLEALAARGVRVPRPVGETRRDPA